MTIAYYTAYVGCEFTARYCQGKKYALSATLKSQNIARALLKAGHKVVIYSSGITTCNSKIPAFTEIETYPEGLLIIKYCDILSFRKCAPINEITLTKYIKCDLKENHYDVFLFYNITLGAALCINYFKNSIKIIEYEDNIFNKALVGGKNNMKWYKSLLYNYIIKRSDGVIAVCLGLLLHDEVKYRVLTPGVINEDVIESVSNRENKLDKSRPVRIILIGGTHYSKGPDLLIKALKYVDYPCDVEFYGNGSFYQVALDEIKNLPSIHRVTNYGYMLHRELIKTLDEKADILINTTRTMGVGPQAAGFPFKMMEYASTGRPIVSSEIGKLDEDFNSHITYYDGEDPRTIAAAIEDVIANYDDKVKNALVLQKRVLAEYTIEGTSRKLDNFFKIIVADESKKEQIS